MPGYTVSSTMKMIQKLVIVAAELLPKKKSQKLTHKEKAIIRRVAGFTYQLTSDEQE